MNTIVHITDNSLDPQIAGLCRRLLVREAGNIPIVSVSQKPIEWANGNVKRIVVGDIGRNWISLYRQLLTGAAAAETDWVVVAEHDCLYSHEHLSYQPDDPGVFWYNHNCWLVQWGGNHPELNGMYSYWPKRLALSQLICHKVLLKECVEERLAILENGADWDKQFLGCGEPGVVSERALDKARRYAASGQPVQLQRYLTDFLTKYQHRVFGTEAPSLDIRHGTNWTGAKRGKFRRYMIEYWGEIQALVNNA